MKVIDLLNKIANGEEVPKKFRYDDREFYLQSKDCWRCDDAIFEECFILEDLNKDIEIIEEDKKIRKLDWIEENTFDKMQNSCLTTIEKELLDSNFKELGNKINEIIDYLEESK